MEVKNKLYNGELYTYIKGNAIKKLKKEGWKDCPNHSFITNGLQLAHYNRYLKITLIDVIKKN